MDKKDYIVDEGLSIIQLMKVIDANARGIAFVCKEGRLLGAVSDGDTRRSIVNGVSIEEPVSKIANYHPLYLTIDERDKAEEFMLKNAITAVPIVDKDMIIKDIRFLIAKPHRVKGELSNQVVIMAGGKGTRLKPYTDILPKPLIPIGEQTIVEHIMGRFEQYGCKKFAMVINYKKNLIKSYFSDCDTRRDIRFVEETEFLGTGGGLSLVKNWVSESFFMTNCDILVEADYAEIMEYHRKQENLITLVCANKKVVMPYGTIELNEEGSVKRLQEKPSFSFLTNTGLYVMEPELLNLIPENMHVDITDVIQTCLDTGRKVGAFLIEEEQWMDMGQMDELNRMQGKIGTMGYQN